MQQFEETSDCFEKPHKRLCLPLTYRLPKMLSESLVNFMRFLIFTRQWNKSLHWHATTLPRWTVTEVTFSALGAFIRYRPEVDILPGKTWKCSMRSAFYWFAEFCHSQRLSQFAASFIVINAETSNAENCKMYFIRLQKKVKKKCASLCPEENLWAARGAGYTWRGCVKQRRPLKGSKTFHV